MDADLQCGKMNAKLASDEVQAAPYESTANEARLQSVLLATKRKREMCIPSLILRPSRFQLP